MGRPLRCDFVLWRDAIGGAERHTLALTRALADSGAAPRIVVLEDVTSLAAHADSRVPIVGLGFRRGRSALWHAPTLRRAVSRAQVVILPSNGFLSVVCRGVAPVLVAMEHGDALNSDVLLRGPRRVADRLVRGLGANALDCEIAVSRVARDAVLQTAHASRVEVIANGLAVETFKPGAGAAMPSRPLRLGTLGRLVPGKGVDLAILGFAGLNRADVELVVGGDGPDRRRLEQLAVECGVTSGVRFAGWVEDVAGFWSSVDVGVFVSDGLQESFGLAMLEALSCGSTILVPDSDLSAELLTGAPGTLKASDMSVSTISGLMSAALRTERPDAGLRRERHEWVARTHGIDACARNYLALFEELVSAASEADSGEHAWKA